MDPSTSDLRALLDLWGRQIADGPRSATGDSRSAADVLAALEANSVLVQHLSSTRWAGILAALEAGADWDDVATALKVSRGEAWSLFCRQTDQLPAGDASSRAAAIKDPLRGRRYN